MQLTTFANPYAEPLIGSIRRECLHHFVIVSARHLRMTLASYFDYYHRSRPDLVPGKQCPVPRLVMDTDGQFESCNSAGFTTVMNGLPPDE